MEIESKLVIVEGEEWAAEWEWLPVGMEFLFGGNENVLISDSCTVLSVIKTTEPYNLKVYSTVSEFYGMWIIS